MLSLLVALQVAAAVPTWDVLETARWQWKPGKSSYTVRVERQRVPSDQDPTGRIRIVVPGHPDFIYTDDRGPGGFVVRDEALGAMRASARAGLRPVGQRFAMVPGGALHGPVLLAFGYAYASDPGLLVAIVTDSAGIPGLLTSGEMDLIDVLKPGQADEAWVLRPSIPQSMGDPKSCGATYDPFHVWRFVRRSAREAPRLVEDSAATEAYNRANYVWAGPEVREDIEVDGCDGASYTIRPATPGN